MRISRSSNCPPVTSFIRKLPDFGSSPGCHETVINPLLPAENRIRQIIVSPGSLVFRKSRRKSSVCVRKRASNAPPGGCGGAYKSYAASNKSLASDAVPNFSVSNETPLVKLRFMAASKIWISETTSSTGMVTSGTSGSFPVMRMCAGYVPAVKPFASISIAIFSVSPD